MTEGKTEWATKISIKLKATLAPGERVTVVQLSPASGHSREVWSGCWPAYTEAQRVKLSGETYLISRSPLLALEDQQRFFTRDLSAALGGIYISGKRPIRQVQIDAKHPPRKEILRAIASDEGRFAQSQITIRAVVYSDMAENSDLGSVFSPRSDQPEDFGKKLGTYLRRSVFYSFGTSDDVLNSPNILENTRRFWLDAFQSMSASVGGIGSDLNMPNAVPVTARTYSLEMMRDGIELEGRISLLADGDGALIDSWIGISRLSLAALAGTFKCRGTGEDQSCKLDATTVGGVTTNSQTETVQLSGSEGPGLTGEIGVRGALVYPLKGTRAE
jgi:hypothetical protein